MFMYEKTQNFVKNFDEGEKVEPFTFELKEEFLNNTPYADERRHREKYSKLFA